MAYNIQMSTAAGMRNVQKKRSETIKDLAARQIDPEASTNV
jgi:hypothetical protein